MKTTALALYFKFKIRYALSMDKPTEKYVQYNVEFFKIIGVKYCPVK